MKEKTIPERENIKGKDKWNLIFLFKSDYQWELLFQEIEKSILEYKSFKGKLHESFQSFKKGIEFHMLILRKLEKIHTYAHLKNDENLTNQLYSGLNQRAMNLCARVFESSSFIIPEIQSIPGHVIDGFLKNESLSEYKFYIEKILRKKANTRNPEVERIIAMANEVTSAPEQIFRQLDNADLKFGTIKDDKGDDIELSQGNFISFLSSPEREVRKNAFIKYYGAYDSHKHTIASALASSIKKDVFISRVRNFESCRKAALFYDNVDESIYDNLLKTVKDNLDPLFRYLSFRKKILGLKELHFYDTYVPVVKEVEFKMDYDEAVQVCLKALEPLGEDYTSVLKNGLTSGWVDRFENKGKRSGAYSSGCYDSPPYILMNYKEDTINSLYTLIHEAGHSMHSYYSRKNQPFANHDYTIFVAEVASTLNETLLSRYLLNIYSDNIKMKGYIINREIDTIRGTLFRQTMFAEFENIIHNIVEKNNPLTLEVITSEYSKLLKIYFGDTMTLDEELILEPLRIPHFYSAYYVYKYATGIAAAIAMTKKIFNEGEQAVKNYLSFLKLGGSKFPIDALSTAGIDMDSPRPVEDAIKYFDTLVARFEELKLR